MEIFRLYSKKLVFYIFLTIIVYPLTGCTNATNSTVDESQFQETYGMIDEDIKGLIAKEDGIDTDGQEQENFWEPAYELTDKTLIQVEWQTEIETENYYIVEQQMESGSTYPQIVMKEDKELFCGVEFLNKLLKPGWIYYYDYDILYADAYILSLCYWYYSEAGIIPQPVVLDFQNVNYRTYMEMESLIPIQEDNDYPNAPWPGNGIHLSLEVLLEEIEKGNCYMDEAAYDIWQENPQNFIESVRRQFQEIRLGSYIEAYTSRRGFWDSYNTGAYKMYLKDGRVGFFIFLEERWDDRSNGFDSLIETEEIPYDFCIEVSYDWRADASMYQMSYDVHRENSEDERFGMISYLQISGIGEAENAVNQAILEDLQQNLTYLDVEKTNRIMKEYGDANYWQELPEIGPPRITWQNERYICVRQEPLLPDYEMMRYAEEWQRYHVYDLETGQSLRLSDVIILDIDFVRWLKDETKIEAWGEFHEGDSFDGLIERMQEDLEIYSEELLLSTLENTEFWIKDDALYLRIPFLDEYGEFLYGYGGTGYPNYIVYAECRIAAEELQRFLLKDDFFE